MHLTEDLNDNLISRAIYALARIDFITALKLFARSIRAKFATFRRGNQSFGSRSKIYPNFQNDRTELEVFGAFLINS